MSQEFFTYGRDFDFRIRCLERKYIQIQIHFHSTTKYKIKYKINDQNIMIKSNIMLTILNNVVKDTETNPKVFEPSALHISIYMNVILWMTLYDGCKNKMMILYILIHFVKWV